MTTIAAMTAAVPATTGTMVSNLGDPSWSTKRFFRLRKLRWAMLRWMGAVDELVDRAGEPHPDLLDLVDQLVGLGLAHVGASLRSGTRMLKG